MSKNMRCLECGSFRNKVINSRLVRNGDSVYRRRECMECKSRFTTYETQYLKGMVKIAVSDMKERLIKNHEKLLNDLDVIIS